MAVTLKLNTPLSSNKPPSPVSKPDPALFPPELSIKFKDGRHVWVSVPQPDHMTIVGYLKPDHFNPVPKSDHDLDLCVKQLMSELATEGGYGEILTTNSVKKDGKLLHYKEVSTAYGLREASVLVQLQKASANAKAPPSPWRLRVEFNPRKLSQDGVAAMVAEITPADTFLFDRFLADAKLTRLDVAVDIVGVAVNEIVIAVQKSGKRVYYIGADGALETIYLNRPTKPPKASYKPDGTPKKVKKPTPPAGKPFVRVYDRLKERASVLKGLPTGATPVTRVEVVREWKAGAPVPANLEGFANPLAPLAVGYVNAEPADGLALARYNECRRANSAARVATLLELSPAETAKLEGMWLDPPPTLIDREKVWKSWSSGLVVTGLQKLVDLAKSPKPLAPGGYTGNHL